MAPDPFRCDTFFSVALLLAFGSLPAALFAVMLPDWILVTGKNGRSDTLCGGSACAENYISDIQEDIENMTVELVTEETMYTSPASTIQWDATNSTMQVAPRNAYEAEASHQRAPKWKPVLLSDFSYVCTRNSTYKILQCKPLSAVETSPNLSSSCTTLANRTDVQPTFEDYLECDALVLGMEMHNLARSAFPAIISSAVICLICAISINMIAIIDKGYPAIKFVLGLLMLGSAVIQITVLLGLRYLVATISTSVTSEASHGAAAYFSTTCCILNVFAAVLLFVSSFTEAPKPGEPPKSNVDVPFRDTAKTDMSDAFSLEDAQEQEFIKIQDDESEEWGFFPKDNDMAKEVRFRLISDSTMAQSKHDEAKEYIRSDYTVPQSNEAKIEQSATLSRFISQEFVIQPSKTFEIAQERELKFENPVKRVAFVLPDESNVSKEGNPENDDRQATSTQESSERQVVNLMDDVMEGSSTREIRLHEITTEGNTEELPSNVEIDQNSHSPKLHNIQSETRDAVISHESSTSDNIDDLNLNGRTSPFSNIANDYDDEGSSVDG